MMQGLLLENTFFIVRYGCPAINLIEEMGGYDDAFAKALLELAQAWKNAIITCIENGKANGAVHQNIAPEAVALYVISGYGGIRNMGKIYGKSCYTLFLSQFKNYLDTLH
jgi:TetR/AcrR family transcriptional regulator, transcriptional repressor for nem operon